MMAGHAATAVRIPKTMVDDHLLAICTMILSLTSITDDLGRWNALLVSR